MLRLSEKIKEQKDKTVSSVPKGQGISPAQMRIQKDISELQLPKTCQLIPLSRDDLLNYRLKICPDEGMYRGGCFLFSIRVSNQYPHEPPRVKCETRVYHPNIDLEGNVCLNILREDWKPVLSLSAVVYGLLHLFLEPNADDPLNKEAAETLSSNKKLFEQNVNRSLRGGQIGSVYYERCILENGDRVFYK